MRSSARKSMTSGCSSVALVVRLKSTSLPCCRGGAPRVADGGLEHLEVHQGLAAEERDVRGLADAGFLERQIDGRLRRLLAHELGLAAVLGIDDLVLAVLVAVLAGEVALVGDVDDQRLDRHRRQRDDLRCRRPDHLILDGPDPVQLGQRVAEFDRAEPIAEHRQQLGRGLRPQPQLLDHGSRAVVEGEHGRARHHVGEALPRGLERVELADAERRGVWRAHGVTVGSNLM